MITATGTCHSVVNYFKLANYCFLSKKKSRNTSTLLHATLAAQSCLVPRETLYCSSTIVTRFKNDEQLERNSYYWSSSKYLKDFALSMRTVDRKFHFEAVWSEFRVRPVRRELVPMITFASKHPVLTAVGKWLTTKLVSRNSICA